MGGSHSVFATLCHPACGNLEVRCLRKPREQGRCQREPRNLEVHCLRKPREQGRCQREPLVSVLLPQRNFAEGVASSSAEGLPSEGCRRMPMPLAEGQVLPGRKPVAGHKRAAARSAGAEEEVL